MRAALCAGRLGANALQRLSSQTQSSPAANAPGRSISGVPSSVFIGRIDNILEKGGVTRAAKCQNADANNQKERKKQTSNREKNKERTQTPGQTIGLAKSEQVQIESLDWQRSSVPPARTTWTGWVRGCPKFFDPEQGEGLPRPEGLAGRLISIWSAPRVWFLKKRFALIFCVPYALRWDRPGRPLERALEAIKPAIIM